MPSPGLASTASTVLFTMKDAADTSPSETRAASRATPTGENQRIDAEIAMSEPSTRDLVFRFWSLASSQRRAAVLVGPRQVGKTTLLLQVADDLLDRTGIPPSKMCFGDRAAPYHAVSLGFHALNAVLLFTLCARHLSKPAALVGATFYAVHPALFTAVSWQSERGDLLAVSFALLAVLLALRSGASRWLAGRSKRQRRTRESLAFQCSRSTKRRLRIFLRPKCGT